MKIEAITLPIETIKHLWSTGQHYQSIATKTNYRVGKMSYGDYLLEPGIDHGEKNEFNPGTLWGEFIENGKIIRFE